MSARLDKRELVKALIGALKEDEELRYTLMGLLGYSELLERFARLEERQQKLEEKFAELEERFARIEERFAKLEEKFARIEERQQRLEERVSRLEECMIRVVDRLDRLERTVVTIGNRFGVSSDVAFREAISGIVEDLFGARAYRWTTYDEEGIVYGYPAEVEVDVVVTDSKHLLVEVKSRVDAGDLLELVRIAQLYERKEGVKPDLAVVAGFVSPKARRLAGKLGVKIYSYIGEG